MDTKLARRGGAITRRFPQRLANYGLLQSCHGSDKVPARKSTTGARHVAPGRRGCQRVGLGSVLTGWWRENALYSAYPWRYPIFTRQLLLDHADLQIPSLAAFPLPELLRAVQRRPPLSR